MPLINSEPGARTHFFMLALLSLGAALRFYDLGAESLWLDEALSWQQARMPLTELWQSITVDVHPPLYALLLHVFISLFGDSEWVLRLPSALCGTLSIWLTWAVCRRLADDRSALFACAFWVLSIYAVRYSQEARMYALMSCLALGSMLLLIRISESRGSQNKTATSLTDFSGYVVITALLLYSHVYGLFIVFAQNAYMAIRYLPGWQQRPPFSIGIWIALQFAIGCLFLPWSFILLTQVERVQTAFWLNKPELSDITAAFTYIMAVVPAFYLGLLAVILGLTALLRPGARLHTDAANKIPAPRHNQALLLVCWLVIPVLLPFLISQFGQPIFHSRYIIAATSAWFMLAGIGIGAIQIGWFRYGLLAIVSALMAGALPVYYAGQTKTDWPAAVSFVEDSAAPGDLVLFHNPDVLAPYSYYAKRDDLTLQTVVAEDTWQAAGVTDTRKPNVRERAQLHQQVWLVSGYDVKTAITEIEIVNQLADTHKPLGGREFSAIRVFQFAAD